MASEIMECLTPYLADIGIVAMFITLVGFIFRLGKNAILKGELTF